MTQDHKLDYNDGNWHGWNGGECPVHPKSRVQWMRHTGGGFGCSYQGEADAHLVRWRGDDKQPAIVAFRVVKPYTAPREWWIVGGCEAYDSEAEALEAAATLFGDAKPVHVREVT